MGPRGARVALLLALAACGAKKSTTANDAGAAAAKAPASAPKPAPADAAVAEVMTASFYRAPGGTATFQYPTLDDGPWKASFSRDGNLPTIAFEFAAGDAQARLEVTFPPRAATAETAEQLARAAAATLAASVGGTVGDAKAMGSSGFAIRVHAKPGAVEVVATIIALVDDRDQALVTATGTAASLGNPAFTKVLRGSLEGLKVGHQIAHAPAADPGRPLDGAYISLGRELGAYDILIFDPHGYLHSNDDVVADLDAIWAIRKGELMRYTYDGSHVEITKPDGTLLHATLDASALMVGDRRYCPEGKLPATLDGHWKAAIAPYISSNAYDTFSFSQSTNYYFASDGRVAYASTDFADHADTVGSPTHSPEVMAGASDHSQGHYRIDGDVLEVQYDDGTTARQRIYMRGCGSDPLHILFIGGQMYIWEP